MTIDVNDEILQDFLVESEEILEQLSEQLIGLEQQPSDIDLLNSVFRGFHTIKGGAGFLCIDPLVEICHRAEDVFNDLRQGQRKISAELMDSILEVLDVIKMMFGKVRQGVMPDHAVPDLIQRLYQFTSADQFRSAKGAELSQKTSAESHSSRLNDEDALVNQEENPVTADFSEEEFEKLLDQIHGRGKFNPAVLIGGDPKYVKSSGKRASSTRHENSLQLLKSAEVPATEVVQVQDNAKTLVAKKLKVSTESTVRVDTQRLDDIMNMVGELVLVRNRLANLKTTMNDEDVANAVCNLDVVTSDLQLAVMKTRMQPIKKVFGRFPRVVRDLARNLSKEIDLEMIGEETDLDKNLVEALADPLVHLVRNSVDHGIEMPDERKRSGKSRRGKIVLSAAQEGDHILLTIGDDGKGMDPDVLRARAVDKGMLDQDSASRLNEKECFNLIFQAGFSTKQKISDVSGRGVGMDVVKTRIAQMNGSVEIISELGKGTEICIKLPLTLAILQTLMVVLDKQPFALPLANVVEIFNLDINRTNVVDNQLTIIVRDKAIPLFYLRKWLMPDKPLTDDEKCDSHVVIVNVGNIQVGLAVDDLIGQEEVVIKPLGAMLHGLQGMAGATITGDGKIALIIDVPGLMRKYARKF
jgi:two-component system chemotaxis sensor kinase CheA